MQTQAEELKGKELMQYIINNRKDFVLWRAEQLFDIDYDKADSDVKKSESIKETCRIISIVPDRLKRETYKEKISRIFKIKLNILHTTVKEFLEEYGDEDNVPLINRVEEFIVQRWELRYNEISNQFEFRDRIKKSELWEILNENIILRQMRKNHLMYSSANLIELLKSDFTPRMNAIKNYFENLPAYDHKDYIAKLGKYIELDNEDKNRERFNRMFKKAFIRSIACSFEVDFNKHCFTLVHEVQNSGKSTFIRWLCPQELQAYYAENIGTDKDSLIALTENFIVNLDELSTLSKYEINSLKSVMSKDKVKVRLPYDRRPSTLHRRCNFWGSTNRREFLSDETGNVRWICFLIDKINWDYKKDIDIDKVWAQAYYLFKNEEPFQLTAAEIFENEQANIDYIVRTPEMEFIQKYFDYGDPDNFDKFMTSSEILDFISQVTYRGVKLSTNNVGKALKILGFERRSKRDNNKDYPVKGYYIKYTDKVPSGMMNVDSNISNGVPEEIPDSNIPFG